VLVVVIVVFYFSLVDVSLNVFFITASLELCRINQQSSPNLCEILKKMLRQFSSTIMPKLIGCRFAFDLFFFKKSTLSLYFTA